jgi:hypothetical protein
MDTPLGRDRLREFLDPKGGWADATRGVPTKCSEAQGGEGTHVHSGRFPETCRTDVISRGIHRCLLSPSIPYFGNCTMGSDDSIEMLGLWTPHAYEE